jgi:hypothetical protein
LEEKEKEVIWLEVRDYFLMSIAFLIAYMILFIFHIYRSGGFFISPIWRNEAIGGFLAYGHLCFALFLGFLVVGVIKRFVK